MSGFPIGSLRTVIPEVARAAFTGIRGPYSGFDDYAVEVGTELLAAVTDQFVSLSLVSQSPGFLLQNLSPPTFRHPLMRGLGHIKDSDFKAIKRTLGSGNSDSVISLFVERQWQNVLAGDREDHGLALGIRQCFGDASSQAVIEVSFLGPLFTFGDFRYAVVIKAQDETGEQTEEVYFEYFKNVRRGEAGWGLVGVALDDDYINSDIVEERCWEAEERGEVDLGTILGVVGIVESQPGEEFAPSVISRLDQHRVPILSRLAVRIPRID